MTTSPPSTRYGPDPTRSPLTRLRLEHGLSQGRLAHEAGIRRETVNRLEQGHERPTWATVARLATVLGCTVDDLFPLDDDDPAGNRADRRMLAAGAGDRGTP